MCGFIPSLVHFRFMAPSLQPEVMGPFPVRDVWFPCHLLLEETGRIQNYGL
jgi:hypothetical protein